MTKPKFSERQVSAVINGLFEYDVGFDYVELMQRYGGIVSWCEWKMKGSETLQKSREVLKRALFRTIRQVSQSEQVDLAYIQESHSGLERVARKLYTRTNGDSPWQLAVEGAGLVYPCRKREEWNLKKVLEVISQRGNKDDIPFIRAASKYCGGYGKASILAGINFISRKKIDKTDYQFSPEELKKLSEDKSLSEEDKQKAIFNALSLQHYDAVAKRKINPEQERFSVAQEFKCKNLETFLEQDQATPELSRVSLALRNIPNRFNSVGFYFEGKKAGIDACKIYYYTNEIIESTLA